MPVHPYSERPRLILLVFFFIAAILAAGIASDIYQGDESFHYRLASYICKAGWSRPLFDPLALTNPAGKSYYVDPQLWHYGLAVFAGAFGGLSPLAAQIYQLFWYGVLVGSTYALGRAWKNKETGFWSALLVATMPISAALTVILHTDIPVAAACTLAVYLVVTRRFLLAGVLYAVATYIKRNSYLLLPGIILMVILVALSVRPGVKDARKILPLKALAMFILPLCILILPELFYRYATFGVQSFWSGDIRRPERTFRSLQIKILPWAERYIDLFLLRKELPLDGERIMEGAPVLRTTDIACALSRQKRVDIDEAAPLLLKDAVVAEVTRNFVYEGNAPFVFYDESNLLMNPWIFVKYFGIAICLAWVLYVLKKASAKQDILLLLPLLVYIPIYVYLFRLGLNARYLSPLIGIASVAGGMGCAAVSRRGVRRFIFVLCIVQFTAALAVTQGLRMIPAGIKQAYATIKDELPEHARVMCSMNALSLHTGRYSIWLGVPALHELGFLFFNAAEEQMREIFDKYAIDYILVEKDKIYDDSSARHTGGYPASFVHKLKGSALFEPVLENEDALLLRIKRDVGTDVL